MLLSANSTRKDLTRNYSTIKRQVQTHREPIKTNQILISDFSLGHSAIQKKKKRCPLWMINKRNQKRGATEVNIFTNQGITNPTNNTVDVEKEESPPKAMPKGKRRSRFSNASSKQTMMPFNFIKAKNIRPMATINDSLNNFPVFYYEPKSRCLYSALSERKPIQQRRLNRRIISSSSKQKKHHSTIQPNAFSAWKTIQVDQDDFI